jgi:hypothetical protein
MTQASESEFFGLRLLGTTPNEEMGTTVSVLLRSRGLGRSSVQSRDSESRRLAICIAGGESQGSTQATLELFLLPAPLPDEKIPMRKYLLSILAIIVATIIAAETAELALDANGNTARILIPKDDFTIEEWSIKSTDAATTR